MGAFYSRITQIVSPLLLNNPAEVHITQFLSSIWHAILDNFRPVTVWLTGLAMHYMLDPELGESWNPLSYIQLAGMCVLFLGTAIYNGSVVVPCFAPPTAGYDPLGAASDSALTKDEKAAAEVGTATAIGYSPLVRAASLKKHSSMTRKNSLTRQRGDAEQGYGATH